MKNKKTVGFFRYLVIIILLVFILFPILYQVISSFKTLGQIYDPEMVLSLRNLSFITWEEAIVEQDFLNYFKNSLITSVISTFFVLLFSIPAGFGLAKLKMSRRMRSNLSFEFLAMRMMPGIAVIIPIFVIYKHIGLLYTMPGLILIYIVFNIPLATWLLEGFFKEVPDEIIEAAKIDGSNPMVELTKIALPIASPGMLAVGILTFIFIWNEYMFASVLTTSAVRTLPVWAAYTTYQHYIINFGMLSVATTAMIIPVIIFAILMQKYLVRGLSLGALKE